MFVEEQISVVELYSLHILCLNILEINFMQSLCNCKEYTTATASTKCIHGNNDLKELKEGAFTSVLGKKFHLEITLGAKE